MCPVPEDSRKRSFCRIADENAVGQRCVLEKLKRRKQDYRTKPSGRHMLTFCNACLGRNGGRVARRVGQKRQCVPAGSMGDKKRTSPVRDRTREVFAINSPPCLSPPPDTRLYNQDTAPIQDCQWCKHAEVSSERHPVIWLTKCACRICQGATGVT